MDKELEDFRQKSFEKWQEFEKDGELGHSNFVYEKLKKLIFKPDQACYASIIGYGGLSKTIYTSEYISYYFSEKSYWPEKYIEKIFSNPNFEDVFLVKNIDHCKKFGFELNTSAERDKLAVASMILRVPFEFEQDIHCDPKIFDLLIQNGATLYEAVNVTNLFRMFNTNHNPISINTILPREDWIMEESNPFNKPFNKLDEYTSPPRKSSVFNIRNRENCKSIEKLDGVKTISKKTHFGHTYEDFIIYDYEAFCQSYIKEVRSV